MVVEHIVWVLRTGAPWRDVPQSAGPWQTIYNRFRRWCLAGVWSRIMGELARCQDRPQRLVLIDSTIVRAHQHAAGARGGQQTEALGRSRGGFTTKVHVAVDARGRPLRMALTAGQRHDLTATAELLESEVAAVIVADRAYDADGLLRFIELGLGGVAVIPSRRTRRTQRALDVETYKQRNAVERFFAWVKRYRRVATRYEKTAASYRGMLMLAGALYWLRFS